MRAQRPELEKHLTKVAGLVFLHFILLNFSLRHSALAPGLNFAITRWLSARRFDEFRFLDIVSSHLCTQTEVAVKTGMVFNISVGFQDLVQSGEPVRALFSVVTVTSCLC